MALAANYLSHVKIFGWFFFEDYAEFFNSVLKFFEGTIDDKFAAGKDANTVGYAFDIA